MSGGRSTIAVVDQNGHTWQDLTGTSGGGKVLLDTILRDSSGNEITFGNTTVSGTVAVSNFPASQPVSAAALPLPANAAKEAGGNLDLLTTQYALQLDDTTTASVTYVGYAAIGAATSASAWRIKKIDESGSMTTITWAKTGSTPDANFTHVWDNRATSISYG